MMQSKNVFELQTHRNNTVLYFLTIWSLHQMLKVHQLFVMLRSTRHAGKSTIAWKVWFLTMDLTWKHTTSRRPRSFSSSHFQDAEELSTNAHNLASAKRGKACISRQHIYKPCTSRWKENCWLNEETSTLCKEGKMLRSYSCDSDRSMLS